MSRLKTNIQFQNRDFEIEFDLFTVKAVEHFDLVGAIDLQSGEIMPENWVDLHNHDIAVAWESYHTL